ncbi:MAG: hypothetical protein WDA12_01260 [Bacilli bacterium]
MINLIKKILDKKKLVGFIVCFLSAIFLMPISSVNALGEITNRHIEFHDSFFEFDNNKDYSFKQAFINAIEFGDLTYENYVILPTTDNRVILINYDLISNNDFKIRWFNSTNKEFMFNFECLSTCSYDLISKTGRTVITSGLSISRTYNYTFYNATTNPTIEEFFTNIDLNLPIYSKNVDLIFTGVSNYSPYYFESLGYRGNIYNWDDKLDIKEKEYGALQKIEIPLTDLYDYDSNRWLSFKRWFKPLKTNREYTLQFELVENVSSLSKIPLIISLNENILDVKQHIQDVANSTPSDPLGGGGGFSLGDAGSFGGGGGGGRFTDDDPDACFKPSTYNHTSFLNKNNYGFLNINFNCIDISDKKPYDFRTYKLVIYHNVEMFETYNEQMDDFYTEELPKLNEDSNLSGFIQPFINLINKKMPIINQFKSIFVAFNFNEYEDVPPTFEISVPAFNLPKMKIIDFSIYSQYREIVFFWIKAGLSVLILIKSYKIVGGYFRGGGS